MSLLDRYRKNTNGWVDAAYKEGHCEERGSYDSNEKFRYSLFLELQYDHHEADHELIRCLFEQEIIARERDTFQGISKSLWLGAFLLAKYKDPSDIALLLRAKNANFDTHCGFDIEFVYWPLGDDTRTYLANNHPNSLDDLQSIKVESSLNEHLYEWWRSKSSEYPDCPEKESIYDLFDRYLHFQEIVKAKACLERLASDQTESEMNRYFLRYAYQDVGDFDKAIELIESIIPESASNRERVSLYIELLGLHVKLGIQSRAFCYIEYINAEFDQLNNMVDAGLVLRTVNSVFEYSLACKEQRLGKVAFRYANNWVDKVNRPPITVLELGVEAAEKWGMYFKSKKYRKLLRRERIRVFGA